MDALAERIRKAAQDIREGKGDPLAELDAIADSLADGRTYTRDAVSAAANAAANLICDDEELFPGESSDSIRIQSFIDLTVNATMSLLDNPGMSLDDVMRANWQHDAEDGDAAEMVRSWL